MKIANQWHHPLFLYEGLLNLFGLIVIYWLCEYIHNPNIRKTGDLFYLYFIWYGIVRIILEPMRYNVTYNQSVNTITTILWIVAGILLIVLNHCWFSKKREYWFWKYHWYLLYAFIPCRIGLFFCFLLKKLIPNKYQKMQDKKTLIADNLKKFKIPDLQSIPYYRGL
jgi:hypothetical protein